MTKKVNLSWADIREFALKIAQQMYEDEYMKPHFKIFGVPRGGIHAAQAVLHLVDNNTTTAQLVTTPEKANIIIDDIIESGMTENKYACFDAPFLALIKKEDTKPWYVFPWERMKHEMGPEENILRTLQYIGEDPKREGLKETPRRVAVSFEKLYGGYKQDPKDVLKFFKDMTCDEIVVLKDIEFYSTCEHHMLPFFGKAHIGYLPKHGKVVGISKLARLLEIHSRRLQIQERIGEHITQDLMEYLEPLGCGCVLEAQHMCMTSRGVEKQNSIMVTSSMQGAFRDDSAIKQEFLRMIGK